MYINKRFSASTHHQVPRHSHDVTSAELQASTQTTLLFSIYIPPVGKVAAIDEEKGYAVSPKPYKTPSKRTRGTKTRDRT
jgi:hypothetical protein